MACHLKYDCTKSIIMEQIIQLQEIVGQIYLIIIYLKIIFLLQITANGPVPKWDITHYSDAFNILPILTFWNSPYSSGNRTSIITITKSANLNTFGNIFTGPIDGNNLMDSAAFWFYTEPVAGKWIQFELGMPQIIDAFQIIGDHRINTMELSTHLFQASNNGITWTTLQEFDWIGNTSEFNPTLTPVPVSNIMLQNASNYPFAAVSVLFINHTAYKYYRTLGVSGVDSGNPYQTEILFKSSNY